MEEQPPVSRLESLPTEKKQSSKKILWAFLVVLVLAILVGGVSFLRFRGGKEVEPTPTPTPLIESTPTPFPTSGLTPTPSPKPKATPTPTTKPTPTVKPKGVSIRILNGSGVVGAAGKAADFLKSLGYEIVGMGNAENYNFEKTEISARGSQALLQLQTDLATKYEIGSTSAQLSATESADAVVIVGKK